MKAIPLLLILAACGPTDGEPIEVKPIEIKITVEGGEPIKVLPIVTKD
jgi:hypothetical protein